MKSAASFAFDKRGFYLHASWQYEYPFAVRKWSHDDYVGMFRLLRTMGLNRVMIWPMTELAPPPLSPDDRNYFEEFRHVIQTAKDLGLECWLVFCANLTTTEAVRADTMQNRVFYPNMRKFRLDDTADFETYIAHLDDILSCVNNADGYVFIDSDPGGYVGAVPADFMKMLHRVRNILEKTAAGTPPKLIPWVWGGWGSDGEQLGGFWTADLQKFVRPFLAALKEDPPAEPWELLPGRSIRDGHANGRINLALTEEAGLLSRSTVLTYEIIEFEPTPPAFVVQFADIRRVIQEELRLATEVRGILGNAQQPICSFHNLFYFARCVGDFRWLNKSDTEVLVALAEFLGGDADVLVPAWQTSQLQLHEIPADLASRLRESALRSDAAGMLPGGAALYLTLLAEFVSTRRAVLEHTRRQPATAGEAGQQLADAVIALLKWWSRHRYVFTGLQGPEFRWEYLHFGSLMQPLYEWVGQLTPSPGDVSKRVAEAMAQTGLVTNETAAANVKALFSWARK